jgi:hypothetical protein
VGGHGPNLLLIFDKKAYLHFSTQTEQKAKVMNTEQVAAQAQVAPQASSSGNRTDFVFRI